MSTAVNNCFSAHQRSREPQQSVKPETHPDLRSSWRRLLIRSGVTSHCHFSAFSRIVWAESGAEPGGISNPQTNLLNLCASPPINPVCPCANCFHMPNKSTEQKSFYPTFHTVQIPLLGVFIFFIVTRSNIFSFFFSPFLQHLNENLAKLTAKFEKATSAKVKCQQEAESTARTISLANRLVRTTSSSPNITTHPVNHKNTLLSVYLAAERVYTRYNLKHFACFSWIVTFLSF